MFKSISDKINPKLDQHFLLFGKWFISKLHSKQTNDIDILLVYKVLFIIRLIYLYQISNITSQDPLLYHYQV